MVTLTTKTYHSLSWLFVVIENVQQDILARNGGEKLWTVQDDDCNFEGVEGSTAKSNWRKRGLKITRSMIDDIICSYENGNKVKC